MPGLDQEAATAMEKLTRKFSVIKVLRRPFTLAKAAENLTALRLAAKGRDWRDRFRAKYQPAPTLVDSIKQAENMVKVLENDFLEGEITPLTESEVWAVRAHFLHLGIYLKKQLVQVADSPEKIEANEAADKTVEIITQQAWMARWVGYAFKRRDSKDNFEQYWPGAQIPPDVEPQVIASLFSAYHASFTLSEEELKKSVAPMTQKMN